jgi:hypothetical protein
MTEAEWNACGKPQEMLKFLRGKTSARKLRLLAVACCRRIWSVLSDERARKSVEAAEAAADCETMRPVLAESRKHAIRARHAAHRRWMAVGHPDEGAAYTTVCAFEAAARVSFASAWTASFYLFSSCSAAEAKSRNDTEARSRIETAQCGLVRDIFGNPFCFVPVNPVWLTWNSGLVIKLAKRNYDERAFGDLPILADAIEDAGCTDAAILDHLRGPGPHVRGCWVLDLILGKS